MNNTESVTVLLFTEMFPFGINSEKAFLSNEISHLADSFGKVVVFPQLINGKQSTSGNFEVDFSLPKVLHKRSKLVLFFLSVNQKLLYKELFSKKITFWNWSHLKRIIYFIARYALIKRWFYEYITINHLQPSRVIVYTYWTNEITSGLLANKFRLPGAIFISRAHGHDLYENYWGYIPCQSYNFKQLDRLFLVSRAAVNYTNEIYPQYREKVYLTHLGVKAANHRAEKSTDGVVRIVSCSYVVKLKRIDLIIKSLAKYSLKFHKRVEWTHFGDGEQFVNMKSLAKSYESDLFSYSFTGFVTNEEVLRYYQTKPVDLFIHLSESEGGVPVAIQEAQAYGIPVIATAAGGIPEIVNSETGILLALQPEIDEIAGAISQIVSDTEQFDIICKNSMRHWQQHFDERKNFSSFVKELQNLISE